MKKAPQVQVVSITLRLLKGCAGCCNASSHNPDPTAPTPCLHRLVKALLLLLLLHDYYYYYDYDYDYHYHYHYYYQQQQQHNPTPMNTARGPPMVFIDVEIDFLKTSYLIPMGSNCEGNPFFNPPTSFF